MCKCFVERSATISYHLFCTKSLQHSSDSWCCVQNGIEKKIEWERDCKQRRKKINENQVHWWYPMNIRTHVFQLVPTYTKSLSLSVRKCADELSYANACFRWKNAFHLIHSFLFLANSFPYVSCFAFLRFFYSMRWICVSCLVPHFCFDTKVGRLIQFIFKCAIRKFTGNRCLFSSSPVYFYIICVSYT